MKILLAPDKFKGSLTAAQVAAAVEIGLLAARPGLSITALPIADGGDGTVAAAVAAGYVSVPVVATGPTGLPTGTSFALLADRAVIELADACGLARLPSGMPAPMTAGSAGLGDVLLAAVRAGAREVIVGVGGSAGTDGGAGMLQALGARILDQGGTPVAAGGAGLAAARFLDLSGLEPALRGVRIVLASDVDNPLLGPTGAAAVYGPQKGADATQVHLLETALANWADVVSQAVPGADPSLPGSGAAGGVGFAALAVLGACARPGIDLILELAGFTDRLADADLVITGEGSLDAQTLQGKGPAGVAAAARAAGIPVIALAGRVMLTRDQLAAAGFAAAYSLAEVEPDPQVSMANAGALLQQLAGRIAANFTRTPSSFG